MELHCENLWLNLIIFVAGSWVLIKGSDLFIDSAAAIARLWNVSELVIGLTLVSIGTSLPEFSTSLYASFQHIGDFTIGNVVGSNITNISLILGIGIVGAGTLRFSPQIFKRDALILIGVYAVTILMFLFNNIPGRDGTHTHGLTLWSGILLLAIGTVYCCYLFKAKSSRPEEEAGSVENTDKPPVCDSTLKCSVLLILGLAMITAGSKAMVDTVVWGAEQLRIPTLVISATIVAFGTSVPELAVTLAGVIKKQHDIAIGNIIGSNIFNIFLIFGACALVTPLPLAGEGGIGFFNIALMFATALLLLLFMAVRKTSLVRWQGVVFVLIYCVFLGFNCKDIIKRMF